MCQVAVGSRRIRIRDSARQQVVFKQSLAAASNSACRLSRRFGDAQLLQHLAAVVLSGERSLGLQKRWGRDKSPLFLTAGGLLSPRALLFGLAAIWVQGGVQLSRANSTEVWALEEYACYNLAQRASVWKPSVTLTDGGQSSGNGQIAR